MKKTLQLLLLSFLFACTAKAAPFPMQYGPKRYGFSAAASGVISIFKVDTRHSERASPRAGFGGMFRMEYYPSSNVHLQIGLEVMTQACTFNTYYFAPGYSTFYDRSFGYQHTLRTVELYVPLIARIGLSGNETNARSIFYLLGGYAPKVFLNASTNIVQKSTGQGIWGGNTELTYENHIIGLQTGNVLIGGMGLDKRIKMDERFVSYELIFRYNLSRFIYTGRNNTNELLIKNCCINLQVGYRFQ